MLAARSMLARGLARLRLLRPAASARVLAALLPALLSGARATLAQERDPVITGLTLPHAVALAVRRDARSTAAMAAAESADERVARARSFFFPDVTLTAALIRRPREIVRMVGGARVIVQRYNAVQGFATLTQPIFDARLFPLYRQALLEAEAAQLGAAERRRLTGFEAAQSFLMVLGAEETLRAAERRLDFSKDRLRDAQARALAGLVSSNDVTRGELEVKNAERQLVIARNAVAQGRIHLGLLLAARIEGPLVQPGALLAAAADAPLDEVVGDEDAQVQARFDVRAVDARVRAMREAVLEPRYRAVPAITLSAQGRYTNEAGLTGRNFDGLAALNGTWQLWDGGERAAEARERTASARAAEAEREWLARTARADVERALAALANARMTQVLSRQAAQVAARHAEETAELYRQGLSGALQVADANQQRFEAEVAAASDRYALAMTYLDVGAALGASAPGAPEERLRGDILQSAAQPTPSLSSP